MSDRPERSEALEAQSIRREIMRSSEMGYKKLDEY
jgi:hypothetical protein